jgi:hypothetical protein
MLRSRQFLYLFLFTLLFSLLTWLNGLAASSTGPLHQDTAQLPIPSPTYDPLAIPTLPANPTQFDLGKSLYYYHCMPCHGDVGQGLTDAFRMVWEEDHRNCWERGCHGGRPQDEGFPVPTIIPAIISPDNLLAKYPDLASLVSYLHDTHPPQRPGKLEDAEYHSLAIFLWVSNNRQLPAGSDSTLAAQPSLISTDTPPVPSPTSTWQATPSATPVPTGLLPTLPPPNPAARILDDRLLSLAVAASLGLLILILIIMKRSHH